MTVFRIDCYGIRIARVYLLAETYVGPSLIIKDSDNKITEDMTK